PSKKHQGALGSRAPRRTCRAAPSARGGRRGIFRLTWTGSLKGDLQDFRCVPAAMETLTVPFSCSLLQPRAILLDSSISAVWGQRTPDASLEYRPPWPAGRPLMSWARERATKGLAAASRLMVAGSTA